MRGLLLAVVLGGAVVVPAQPTKENWDFEKAEPDKLPQDWSAAKTGTGPGSVWKVLEDESAPAGAKVLAQTSSEGPNPLFNLCVADKTSYADLDLTLSLKAVSGRIDQGGGPVWRYQDQDNYYIARMNPLEANFRIYRVVKGRRTQLGSARLTREESRTGVWHTIRIVQRGDHIRCYLNDKLLLEGKDTTFSEAGKIGLWTKADAVTSFDKISVAEPAEEKPAEDKPPEQKPAEEKPAQ